MCIRDSYGTVQDTAALRRLTDLAASDRSRAVTRLRRDRDDGTQFIESWADLTAWTPVKSQVSGGKTYGLSTTQDPGGGAHAISVPKGSRFTMSGTVNALGGNVYTMFGLCNAAPPFAAGGTGSLMWGLLGTGPIRFNTGGSTLAGATVAITPVGDTGTVAASGEYTVSITGDELGISASLINAAHSKEWTDFIAWADIPSNFLSVSYWLNDPARQLTGAYIGPITVNTSANTPAPPVTIGDKVINATDAAGNTMRVCLPPTYDSRTPCPVVMYHHGSSETAAAPFAGTEKRAMMQALTNAGYIVASTDAAGITSWGNNAAIQSYIYLYRYLRDHVAIGPIHHLAQSMGGISALLTLAAREVPAASVALIFPCTNLAAMYANTGWGSDFTVPINAAYGIPGSGTYAAQTAGHDPALMAPTAFRGVPVWGIGSHGDVIAVRSLNLDPFVAAVTPYASEVTVLTSTGDHGDATNFNATAQASLLAFLNRNSVGSGA